ncbi:MAG: MerR family transcriptional regulator, partial [Actinobacteria bacterium]|nr:MerR family transcriptional regulator [Actinomycetota bacterium]
DAGKLISIGEFARRARMSPRRLRYYHRLGLLMPARIDPENGYRYYRDDQAAAAEAIALLRSLDVPLREVQEVVGNRGDADLQRVFERQRQRLQGRLAEAKRLLGSLDHAMGEAQVNDVIGTRSCSFCRRPADAVEVLVQGPTDVFICDRCALAAQAAVEQAKQEDVGTIQAGLYPLERFTPSARQILQSTQTEAAQRHHAYVGTEHMLLALAKADVGPVADALSSVGLDYGRIEENLGSTLPPGLDGADIIPSARIRRVVALAIEDADAAGRDLVGADGLLLAILREGRGLAADLLVEHGLDQERANKLLSKRS